MESLGGLQPRAVRCWMSIYPAIRIWTIKSAVELNFNHLDLLFNLVRKGIKL